MSYRKSFQSDKTNKAYNTETSGGRGGGEKMTIFISAAFSTNQVKFSQTKETKVHKQSSFATYRGAQQCQAIRQNLHSIHISNSLLLPFPRNTCIQIIIISVQNLKCGTGRYNKGKSTSLRSKTVQGKSNGQKEFPTALQRKPIGIVRLPTVLFFSLVNLYEA